MPWFSRVGRSVFWRLWNDWPPVVGHATALLWAWLWTLVMTFVFAVFAWLFLLWWLWNPASFIDAQGRDR